MSNTYGLISQHEDKTGVETYHSKLIWRDVSVTIQIEFAESSLAAYAPPFRVKLGHLMYMESCCNKLFEVHQTSPINLNWYHEFTSAVSISKCPRKKDDMQY